MSKNDLKLLQQFAASISARFDNIIPADPPKDGWILDLEKKLSISFPSLYFQFASLYKFGEFECSGIRFFANASHEENGYAILPMRIFEDRLLGDVLFANGLLQIGVSDTGSYDPICFANGNGNRRDRPILRIDHESILLKSQARIVRTYANSFREVVERAVKYGTTNSL